MQKVVKTNFCGGDFGAKKGGPKKRAVFTLKKFSLCSFSSPRFRCYANAALSDPQRNQGNVAVRNARQTMLPPCVSTMPHTRATEFVQAEVKDQGEGIGMKIRRAEDGLVEARVWAQERVRVSDPVLPFLPAPFQEGGHGSGPQLSLASVADTLPPTPLANV